MDQAIGQVLAALDRAGLVERTLVVFLSDNGGPTRSTTSRNGPLRGFKGHVYEGGVRVPFALRWPGGGLRAGTTYDAPVVPLDVVPTALAAAGAPAVPDARLDGVNLLPHLRGETPGRPHAALYWRFGAQRAVRVGDWKLVEREGEPPELYRLSDDLAEATNLADRHPGRVLDLQTVWAAWNLETGRRPGAAAAARASA